MPENWLLKFLSQAVERKLCTRYGCTTCGAMEFRRGLWRAAEASHSTETAVAEALANVEGGADSEDPFARALYLAVTEVCDAIGEADAARLLGDSWAGRMLGFIQKQDFAYEARRAGVDAEQRAAQERALLRKLERQKKHGERLQAKHVRESWPFPLAGGKP